MKRIIFAAIAAISCNAAFAAEPAAYVSASVGSAEQKLSIEGISVTDSDTAFQIAGGYRFTPNVGVEAGYTNFGTGSISGNGVTVSSKPQSAHVAVTGAWNFTPEFAITGKLGAAHTRTKAEVRFNGESESTKDTHTSLMYGVGVSYAFTPKIALIAEYQDFGKIIKGDAGESLKAHVVSAGVRFSF
jgi:OOP family OmpA-OmpF porin